MNRRDRRRARKFGNLICSAPDDRTRAIVRTQHAGSSSRKSLLLGTALASTVLIGTFGAPETAQAQTCDPDIGTGPTPIFHNENAPINCVNTEPRTGAGAQEAIDLRTQGDNQNLVLDTEGLLTATRPGGTTEAIFTRTQGENSNISIDSRGNIVVEAGGGGRGIVAFVRDSNSSISITNTGDISVDGGVNAFGIRANDQTGNSDDNNDIEVNQSSRIEVTAGNDAMGVRVEISGNSGNNNSEIDVTVGGSIVATGGRDAIGIRAQQNRVNNSSIVVDAGGSINAMGDRDAIGVQANILGPGAFTNNELAITSDADIRATSTGNDRTAIGIFARGQTADTPVSIVTTGGSIAAVANGMGGNAYGISAITNRDNSLITVDNSGDIWATSTGNGTAHGIFGRSQGPNSSVHIINSGDVTARATTQEAYGIAARTGGDNSSVEIVNNGSVNASSDFFSFGIGAATGGPNSPITVTNNGDVSAVGPDSHGISVSNYGQNSLITINNAGSVRGGTTGVRAGAYDAPNPTKIFNTGDISASSHRAIDVNGYGRSYVYNSGLLTGFVDLTDQSDRFVNQAGGVFETKKTSFFGGGSDLFVNAAGGTVQAATDPTKTEKSFFEGLETFRNRGLISMVDGKAGDKFTISNTPGDTDLNFDGGGFLSVDAFLGGPGSPTDTFKIEGDVSGTTTVVVNNTNFGPGVFNPTGTDMVVEVTGATPSASNFQLAQTIDTGFFDYDLFFTPTNSGFWELRSFPGGGAHLLPQLLTAAQDIWHQGSSTWFDRTADLRVLMAGGAAPTAYDPGGSKTAAASGPYQLTPAVWARGSGGWLGRDDSARTRAYGRNYTFDLDRELTTIDFQVGVDMGSYDVLGQGDALVFGVLGGFVHGALDYEVLARTFDFNGGQVGAYATYLNGGLFVDTLLNAHIYSLGTGANLGFPDSLDANTVGLRTDAGYRFGSFTGGAFLEPLGTIEVMWADIDGFSLGGNTVSFNNEANVRGRLGLRAGTTMQAWEGTLMEPFVIGSLWSNLSDNNSATLVSTGTTFRFNDDLEDVWGEISAGVNFFNFSQTTAVFAKVDVTVGDDISGIGGKAGMRVNW